MSSFYLKIIALFAMILDHIGKVFLPKLYLPAIIGKISFPIFSYQISYAYTKTKDKKSFLLKILIFAIISQIPYMLMASLITTQKSLNVLFSYFFSLSIIYLFEQNKIYGFIYTLIVITIISLVNIDYTLFGLLFTICFYYFNAKYKYKHKKQIMILVTLLLCIGLYTPNIIKWINIKNYQMIKRSILFIGSMTLSFIPIYLHNYEEGKKLKYFFYIAYPVHMIIIYLISLMLHI